MSGSVIDSVDVRTLSLTPAAAEVQVTFATGDLPGVTEVRGRFTGPRCEYATTVEVAYPARPVAKRPDAPTLAAARVLIPEPSFWEPESPFLYRGPFHLWEGGRRWPEVTVTHGLREFRLGPRGLRWNGRERTVRGVARERLSGEDALRLRRSGCNTLLAPVTAENEDLWAAADRFGFLVIGRPTDRESLRRAETLRAHPSCFAWLLPEESLRGEAGWGEFLQTCKADGRQAVGAQLESLLPESKLRPAQFVVCDAALLPRLEGVSVPKLVRGAGVEPGGTVLGSVADEA